SRRVQFDVCGNLLRHDVHRSFRRVDCRTAPVGSAIVAGYLNRPLEAGRREEPLIARRAQELPHFCLVFVGEKWVDVLLGERLPREWRRRGGEGLRWRSLFSRSVGLWHGPFFNWPEWCTGHSIEHVEKSLFRRLRHDVDVAAVVADGQEFGRSWKIVV